MLIKVATVSSKILVTQYDHRNNNNNSTPVSHLSCTHNVSWCFAGDAGLMTISGGGGTAADDADGM